MNMRLQECLTGTESREYILPFFWQHGEDHETLREEIEAIQKANVNEFCVESRTHQEFGREQWWIDFGFILEEAKRRGMRVWLLDDKFFPTGYANGYVLEHPELKKTVIRAEWRDYCGPDDGMTLIPPNIDEDESFVAITAFKRNHHGQAFTGDPIDLLPTLSDGLLTFDIPEGNWRVYYIIRSHRVPNEAWIDMLSKVSVESQIKAVYEPTYEHFSEYFGNTFAGFFSDEPCFGNSTGTYECFLGRPDMVIPWNDELPALIGKDLYVSAERIRLLLPALFHTYEGREFHAVRNHYVDVITKLYSENFTKRLGNWSREHGVQYIGHIIEDMNTHQRIGYGPGHFFRALHYEDMSGMDIVLQQIMPGVLDVDHSGPVSGNVLDPDFFNYYLAKLPESQAALTPHMKRRAMCEIFGAFGWAEGLPFMKLLTDHMISNGINYFVPHAFSPKYPDHDCPPHFYARGMNTQYEGFGELMNYMRRCAHMITGKHFAPAALLYTAEAEWAGSTKMMPGQLAGRELIRSQIDYDIVWEDILKEACVEDGPNGKCLKIRDMEYRVLIIPESEYLPAAMLADIAEFIRAGLPVIVTGQGEKGAAPMSCEEGTLLMGTGYVPVNRLGNTLRARGIADIEVSGCWPCLRYRRLEHDGKAVYFFFNEDVHKEARFTVKLVENGPFCLYDPWKNKRYTPKQNGAFVDVQLPPSCAIFIVEDAVGEADLTLPAFEYTVCGTEVEIEDLKVSVREAKEEGFRTVELAIGEDLTRRPEFRAFGGVIRYEGTMVLTGKEKILQLNNVGEVAKVSLNGCNLGYAVGKPYGFEVSGIVREGENDIVIEVMNNLGYRERDFFSSYLPLPKSGLMGPITVQ